MSKVLVVDDEKLIVKGIKFSLEQDDMQVDTAYDGEQAIEAARNCEYDVVLLDVMLPKYDGFEVCRTIREFSNMPIIMLTARGEEQDELFGFELGVDEYISKPFSPKILVARVEALLKRTAKQESNVYDIGGIEIVSSIPRSRVAISFVYNRVIIRR